VTVPSDPSAVQEIAVDWISRTWRQTQDTRWAVTTLARLGDPEFDLGLFIGLTTSGVAVGEGLTSTWIRPRSRYLGGCFMVTAGSNNVLTCRDT
jgi:hypothetical protein